MTTLKIPLGVEIPKRVDPSAARNRPLRGEQLGS
jgi:hypothetical protein